MSKFMDAMKKVGHAFDDIGNIIKKLDPNPVDVITINLLQMSIKELNKQVKNLHGLALDKHK